MFNVGFAGETVGPSATVTLDSIGAYANAAQLVTALQTLTTGDMVFLQMEPRLSIPATSSMC